MWSDDTIPKCRHGYIILGCPDEDCSEQNEYLAHQQEAMDAHYLRQELNAMAAVRSALEALTARTAWHDAKADYDG